MSAIDKIVIYGVANPERLKLTEVLSNKIPVGTLELYENPEQVSDGRAKQIDFEMWAYPDGIKVYNNHLQIINDSQPQFSFFQPQDLLIAQGQNRGKTPPEYIYSFILTDYDLNRTYCTCIIWNERYFIKDDREQLRENKELAKSMTDSMSRNQQRILFEPKEQYSLAVPKCRVETMINNPLILDSKTTLVYIPKAMIVCSKTPCIEFQRGLLKYYHANVISETTGKDKPAIKIPRILENHFYELIKNYGYPRAQTLFNQAKTETVRKMQFQLLKNSMKDVEKDRSWGLLSVQTSKLKDFFISAMFALPDNKKNSYILTQSGQRIGSRLKSDTVFHLPKILDLFTPQSQRHPRQPILPLPIPEFIQLWKCLLLEKQIIIFSNSQQKSLALCELMLYLIQPIKWENIYIPFLPFHLAHHIDAIGGYLIGMSRIHMDYMLERFQMKSKVVVDLQHQTILEEGGKEVIELPQPIQAFLENELKSILQVYEQFLKPNRSLINYLILNPQQPEKEKTQYTENYVKCYLKIQKLFFHALVVLFNNFIPFIVQKDDGIIAVRTEEYLNILEDKRHRNFMKEISKTMVFIRLCEYHMEESERCAWVQRSIGELFVYSHDILSHKFIVFDSDINKTRQPQPKVQKQPKRAYAWTIQDLLLPHEKYNQYIEYLFEKNTKEILNTVITVEQYLGEEENKYRILVSEDQFESFQELESIQIPADFGKRGNKATSAAVKKTDRELQYRNIYEQIQSQEVSKSKRYKKFGDKDEEQLYEQMSKLCTDLKVQKYLIKYLKYMELNYPQSLVKQNPKHIKKQSNKTGILNWLWDIVNPPDATRGKQESEVKSKLQRKMTMKNIKTDNVLNLKCLFGLAKGKSKDESLSVEKNRKESLDAMENSKDKHEKVEHFLEKMKEKGRRASQTHSDMVTTQKKIEEQ